jgi:hypothetical protein
MIDKQEQPFNRSLPLRELLFGLRKFLDIFGGVIERANWRPREKRDRVIEQTFPSAISHRRAFAAGIRSRSRRLHFSAQAS